MRHRHARKHRQSCGLGHIKTRLSALVREHRASPLGLYRHRHDRKHHRPRGIGTRLSDLSTGQRAKIIRVGGRGRVRRRFMEMGLVNGETIRVERVAPLGDPVEFFVKGYHVSLRRNDAQHIQVRLMADESGDSV